MTLGVRRMARRCDVGQCKEQPACPQPHAGPGPPGVTDKCLIQGRVSLGDRRCRSSSMPALVRNSVSLSLAGLRGHRGLLGGGLGTHWPDHRPGFRARRRAQLAGVSVSTLMLGYPRPQARVSTWPALDRRQARRGAHPRPPGVSSGMGPASTTPGPGHAWAAGGWAPLS